MKDLILTASSNTVLEPLKMRKICLDTSAYLLPCDLVPYGNKHREKLIDQRATLRIKELAEKGWLELFIPANVHYESRKKSGVRTTKQFWESANVQLLPQEIGFAGPQQSVGRDAVYQKGIDGWENALGILQDKSFDSSIILNSWFFGMVMVSIDYKRIKKIRRQFNSGVKLYRPSELVTIIKSEMITENAK
ncbi:MAG: hypothetical protein HY208_07620 [Nitrospirae bacterium]|nr:hypothetical protein [Nitrospirota bacterium]